MNDIPLPVIKQVIDMSETVLRVYAEDPKIVTENANAERRITKGGYGDRQLFEVVQNGADEVAAEPGGKVHAVLTESHLYCANQGTPVTPEGVDTILRMGVSNKRGGQIGRFGVGVKSVLVVTDTPQFFSESGSFGFDRTWALERIRSVPNVTETLGDDFEAPVLRMARPLDEAAERAADPVLDELLGTYTTVVRLPLLEGMADRLSEDMLGHTGNGRPLGREEFPAGFQLFSPHVGTVTLEDRRRRPIQRRVLTVTHDGVHHSVHEVRTQKTPETRNWWVFRTTHEPSPAARADAGELHDRVSLDLAWAVPKFVLDEKTGLHQAQSGRGRMWSFFPTKYEMTLTGILNGAWKTNEDRQNLLDASAFNTEMLRVAAELVVASLPELAPAEDPAAYLPLLPGRTKAVEMLSWADESLTRTIWDATSRHPSLPDQDGVLRLPRDLHVHPALGKDKALARWLEMWHAYPGRPTNWLHPSVEATDLRSGKVEHVLSAARKERSSLQEWLEAVVMDGSPKASAVALAIVADIVETAPSFAAEARTAKVLLTEDMGMVPPAAGQIYLRSDDSSLRETLTYVHPELAADPEAARALRALGVREADAEGRFLSVLEAGFDGYGPRQWEQFWDRLHRAGSNRLGHRIMQKVDDAAAVLHVRTVAGRFVPVRDAMLPGPVVTAESDPTIAVDPTFHSDDRSFFHDLRLSDRPTPGHDVTDTPWFDDYREALRKGLARKPEFANRAPSLATIKAEGSAVGGPLHLLERMSEEARARFLTELPTEALIDFWTVQVGNRSTTRQQAPSPIRWVLRKHGRVWTSQGVKPLKQAVGPQLAEYGAFLPVADLPVEKARKLHLATTLEELPSARWQELFDELSRSEDDAFVGSMYVLLTRRELDFPEGLTRCRVGDAWEAREDAEIAVTADPGQYRALRAERVPALLVGAAEDAELMISYWNMMPFTDVISVETRHVASDEPVPVGELFPSLRKIVAGKIAQYSVVRCSELEEVTRTPNGVTPRPLRGALLGSQVLVADDADRLQVLVTVAAELRLGLDESRCRLLLDNERKDAEDKERRDARKRVRDTEDVVEKLLLLLGADTLRERLPETLLDAERSATGDDVSDRRAAELALHVHEEGILQVHARDLQQRYPDAPGSFHGSAPAVRFVSELGFPGSFAGFRTPTLESRIDVDGPRDFPRLHAYQEKLAEQIFAMLDRLQPQRAMLSLPTGAGKTRIVAEAVIRWIKQAGELSGPILWVGQTEELCEQAVQSWKFVWEKVGAAGPLTISRLWSTREVGPVDDRPHLVVAMDAKLDMETCLADPSYDWLRRAALVIVDEAHAATAPRYTRLLKLLGLTAHQTERHLLGLTATPFRGRSEEETKRLVERFGAKRLDEGAFAEEDPYTELRKLGVLARVEHQVMHGGSITLSREEIEHVDKMRVLSRAAELRLAQDHERSARIVEQIAEMPRDWPVLAFATSVDHAKTLAAQLKDLGITAASIDGGTSPQDRQSRVEGFRSGRIRVLTNFGVLTQGFDAPATRAVVVARPVYSPNVYQQMIGRGLRGVLNGGKETCLILDVRDNIENYDHNLAFTEFEHLWSRL
ncbi:DEAD/DEAH box helicase [Streptomyces tubbatahanensis]|uniref:DEAD/DEAH box helicase n=1 Tax=Streptomyces tubbatahanensis TaxID=2923272 RepID=A0ABY3XRZ8_9ACTN|nr:DEAD/DEAH box helicase [Streptomyces tubbatahanensis]UNS97217.1 DEAD/DEAH box helicase [Streptomyces tubbatahanensis]